MAFIEKNSNGYPQQNVVGLKELQWAVVVRSTNEALALFDSFVEAESYADRDDGAIVVQLQDTIGHQKY